MTLAEAIAHTAWVTGEDREDRLWQIWLTDRLASAWGGKDIGTFAKYRDRATGRRKAASGLARRVPAYEQAANIELARKYVRFKGSEV